MRRDKMDEESNIEFDIILHRKQEETAGPGAGGVVKRRTHNKGRVAAPHFEIFSKKVFFARL